MQADELLLSIQACPGVHEQCAGMIEYNKWECLLVIQDASIVAVLGEKLRGWDGISLTHLYQQGRLQAREGSMVHQPPWLWMRFPPAFDPVQMYDEVASWVDAEEWMPGPDHASILLKFVKPEVGECLASLTIT